MKATVHFNGILQIVKTKNHDRCHRRRVSVETLKCSFDDCKSRSVVEMLCSKCEKHFCLAHRHHECQETVDKKELPKWKQPKEQFKKVKAETDKQVEEKLNAAQKVSPANRALVNKIKLMKIKGKAVGDNKIPVVDRVFFSVHHPYKENEEIKECRPFFVSKTWTIGRMIDYISNRMRVINKNNEPDSPKLRLFIKETGLLVTHEMNTIISTLVHEQMVIDGDSLILEYVSPDIAKQCATVSVVPDNYTK